MQREEDRIFRLPISEANVSVRISCSDLVVPDYFMILSHPLLLCYLKSLSCGPYPVHRKHSILCPGKSCVWVGMAFRQRLL